MTPETTAAAHNAPQAAVSAPAPTPHSALRTPHSPFVPRPTREEIDARRPKPAPAGLKPAPTGWWAVKDISGARDKVAAAIQQRSDVPDWGKAVLVAAIHSRPAEFNFIFLDAHWHEDTTPQNDQGTLHLTIQGTKAHI